MKFSFGIIIVLILSIFIVFNNCEDDRNEKTDDPINFLAECDSVIYGDTINFENLQNIDFPSIEKNGNFHFKNRQQLIDTMKTYGIDSLPEIDFCRYDLIGQSFMKSVCYDSEIYDIKINYNELHKTFYIAFYIIHVTTQEDLDESCWIYEPINDTSKLKICICDDRFPYGYWYLIPKLKNKLLEIEAYFLE